MNKETMKKQIETIFKCADEMRQLEDIADMLKDGSESLQENSLRTLALIVADKLEDLDSTGCSIWVASRGLQNEMKDEEVITAHE